MESWQVWCSLYLLVIKMQFWYLGVQQWRVGRYGAHCTFLVVKNAVLVSLGVQQWRVGRYGAHCTFWWLKMQFWYLWVFSSGELAGMVLIVPFGG